MLATLLLTVSLSLTGDLPVSADDDPLKLNEEMKQYVNAHVEPGGDAMQRLQTLVRVVFQEQALHFTYEPETRTAIETFAKHSGNCLSFTFLFIAMARHLGLDARFREVDIVPIWSNLGNVVSMSGHANAAVFIAGQLYSVDLFPQVNRIQLGGRVVSDGRAAAHFYNNRGVEHLSLSQHSLAIECFQRALKSDPTMVDTWINMGVAQAIMGQSEEAEKSYHKALELDSKSLVAMSNLAALYGRLGRDRDVKSFSAKVRKFKQRNPYYHFSLGLQAYHSGKYRESIEHYKAALKLKSKEHNFYLALAKAYFQLGEKDKVADCLKLALKNAPDEASKLRYNEKLELLASMRPHS